VQFAGTRQQLKLKQKQWVWWGGTLSIETRARQLIALTFCQTISWKRKFCVGQGLGFAWPPLCTVGLLISFMRTMAKNHSPVLYDFYEINFTLGPATPIRDALCGDFVPTPPRLIWTHIILIGREMPVAKKESECLGGGKSFQINPKPIS